MNRNEQKEKCEWAIPHKGALLKREIEGKVQAATTSFSRSRKAKASLLIA